MCTDGGGGGGGQREKRRRRATNFAQQKLEMKLCPCYCYLAGSARYKNAVKMSGWQHLFRSCLDPHSPHVRMRRIQRDQRETQSIFTHQQSEQLSYFAESEESIGNSYPFFYGLTRPSIDFLSRPGSHPATTWIRQKSSSPPHRFSLPSNYHRRHFLFLWSPL